MKAIIVYQNNEPVLAYAVRDLTSSEFLKVQKESKINLDRILSSKIKEKEEILKRISDLEREVKVLKGEE